MKLHTTSQSINPATVACSVVNIDRKLRNSSSSLAYIKAYARDYIIVSGGENHARFSSCYFYRHPKPKIFSELKVALEKIYGQFSAGPLTIKLSQVLESLIRVRDEIYSEHFSLLEKVLSLAV